MPQPALNPQPSEGRAPLAGPSLDWLIDPVSKAQFFDEYWEQKPLAVSRNQPDYFSALLSLDEVDRVLTTLDRRYPDVVLKNAARRVDPEEYTVRGDSLDIARIYQLFGEGSTITLAYLDTVVPTLASLARALEAEFSFPSQTNVYLTPPAAQGAKPHYDTHDVLVLQVAGSKRWTIYGTPVELPLAGQDFDPSVHVLGAPTLEFELKAGDVAYVPRGVMHDARATDSVSLHITAGILRYTWADLLVELVASASLQDPAFRRSLPHGFARQNFDREKARAILRDLLQRLSLQADLDRVLDGFVDEFISACPPLLRGQGAQIDALPRLTAASVVGARPGVIAHLRSSADSFQVECYGRTITFPSHVAGAVRFALRRGGFAIHELPGYLDDASKLALVRRLIREGLVTAFPPSLERLGDLRK